MDEGREHMGGGDEHTRGGEAQRNAPIIAVACARAGGEHADEMRILEFLG